MPNDIYFGASDRVYTVSTKLHWQHQKQKGRKHQSRAKVSTDRDDDGVESSDNEEEEWIRRKAKKAEEIARLKLPAYQQQQLQQLVLKKHPKRDRFYDRSQDIPNDIYFGNVNGTAIDNNISLGHFKYSKHYLYFSSVTYSSC